MLAAAGTGVPVGHIHVMSKHSTTNLKATCRCHRKCKLWVTPKAGTADSLTVLKDLATWVSHGATLGADDHDAYSREMRIKYGHKPRAKKTS